MYWNKDFPPNGATKQDPSFSNKLNRSATSTIPDSLRTAGHHCSQPSPQFERTPSATGCRPRTHPSDTTQPTAQYSQNSSGSPSSTATHCARPRSSAITKFTSERKPSFCTASAQVIHSQRWLTLPYRNTPQKRTALIPDCKNCSSY
jgi:hypothetical protein